MATGSTLSNPLYFGDSREWLEHCVLLADVGGIDGADTPDSDREASSDRMSMKRLVLKRTH